MSLDEILPMRGEENGQSKISIIVGDHQSSIFYIDCARAGSLIPEPPTINKSKQFRWNVYIAGSCRFRQLGIAEVNWSDKYWYKIKGYMDIFLVFSLENDL